VDVGGAGLQFHYLVPFSYQYQQFVTDPVDPHGPNATYTVWLVSIPGPNQEMRPYVTSSTCRSKNARRLLEICPVASK
jgi:hypothetical protein